MTSRTTASAVHVSRRAWLMLALGVAAQSAGTFLVSTPAFLIPFLHVEQGLDLVSAGLVAAAPTIGMVLTLVAWGALADRVGERGVIAGGLALTAVFAAAGALAAAGSAGSGGVSGFLVLWLVLGGAAAASTNAASGRVVVGWFPRERRGLAMGIRQMSQPLGVAVAALVVPPLAAGAGVGVPLALAAGVTAVLAGACALGIRNPPRAPVAAVEAGAGAGAGGANPYRGDRFLVRIHVVSVLLVVPQFMLSTFGLLWLIVDLGVDPLVAGVVVSVSQFVGAGGRIVIGAVSDRVGTRVGVLRVVCVAGILLLVVVAAFGALGWPVAAAVAFVVATAVSVADNGLAFTSVAEAAGPQWSGRALGVQNTGQFLAASAVGPAVGALIALVGYPLAFAAAALTPLVALPLVPRRDADRTGT